MDKTVNEIEAQIDRTRDRLGSNLRELEHRVDSATDWRERFRERPHLFLGTAFVGGVMLAGAFRRASPRLDRGAIDAGRAFTVHGSAQTQAMELWNHVQGALVGVAGARIKEFMEGLVPGFDEHYRRAEQRASEPITSRTTS
jgi:hypothetical protein